MSSNECESAKYVGPGLKGYLLAGLRIGSPLRVGRGSVSALCVMELYRLILGIPATRRRICYQWRVVRLQKNQTQKTSLSASCIRRGWLI